VQIREATTGDAEALVKLFESLYRQTNYMLMEPGESTQSAESLAQRIETGVNGDSEVWLVCDSDVQPIGVLYGRRGPARRNRHFALREGGFGARGHQETLVGLDGRYVDELYMSKLIAP
jgi:hypothetical protein